MNDKRIASFIDKYGAAKEIIYARDVKRMSGVMAISGGEAVIAADTLRAFKDLCLKIPRGKKFRVTVLDAENPDYDLIISDIFDVADKNRGIYDVIKKGGSAANSIISDKKHPVFKLYRELESAKARAASSAFAAEGDLLVERAVCDGLPVLSVLYTPEFKNAGDAEFFRNIEAYKINPSLMSVLTPSYKRAGAAAMIYFPLRDINEYSLETAERILICDSLSNPDNLGMTIRTADGFGADAVVVLNGGDMIINKNCVRSARGAVGRMTAARCGDEAAFFNKLRRIGFDIIASSSKNSPLVASEDLDGAVFPRKAAFIVGNENHGVRPEIIGECGRLVKIPMAPGQSSFNVAVAAGILLYEHTVKN